ncbi:MAG: efflux transporter outer membrane subunit [Rhodospirillales bacterium]|nr:efflux transporter outer membrane subunit [Rhodospirillales bacterium]
MSASGRAAALLGIVLATAGCTMVGPDFTAPDVSIADQWMEARDASVDATRAIDAAWWTVFDDEALNRLVTSAYQQNLSLQAAGVRVLQSRAQLAIAVGNIYPQTQQAFGSISYNRESERAPFQTQSSASALTYWQDQIGLQAAWEIDFWGRFRRAVQAADAQLLASIADYDDVLVTLTADVATNYVNIRTLEARLGIAHDNVKVQRESLNIAEIRFQGGTTSERDVEQARTVLASTEATIPQLEAALRQSKNALCVLLGVPPQPLDSELSLTSGIPVAPAQVSVGIPADLLRRRPDVRAAELQAASQSAQIGVAKADLYPAFSLTGNFGYLSSDWSHYDLTDIFMSKSRAFSIGPTIQWNFLNYGQITNNVRAQDAAFQAQLAVYQNTVLVAQQEVEDGLVAFLRARQRTDLLQESSAAARRSLDLAVLQYREGITDFTTVLTAEQNLLTQEDSLAVSRGDIPSSLVRTYRALGGGWEIRGDGELISPAVRDAMDRRTDWGTLLTPGEVQRASEQPPSAFAPTPVW